MARKAQILDANFIALFIFYLAFTVAIVYLISASIKSNVYGTFSATAYQFYSDMHSAYAAWDYIIVALFFGLWIFSLMSAWFSRSHPVLFVVSLFTALVNLFVSVLVSNMFYEMVMASSDLQTAFAFFSKTSYILEHLPTLAFLLTIVVAVLLHLPSKNNNLVVDYE